MPFWASSGYLTICGISAFIFTWHSSCVPVSVYISPFYKDMSHIGFGPTLMISSEHLTSAVTLIPNRSHDKILDFEFQ